MPLIMWLLLVNLFVIPLKGLNCCSLFKGSKEIFRGIYREFYNGVFTADEF